MVFSSGQSRKLWLFVVVIPLTGLACLLGQFGRDGLAMLDGYESEAHREYENCLSPPIDLKEREICSRETGYWPPEINDDDLDGVDLSIPPVDDEVTTASLGIESINASSIECSDTGMFGNQVCFHKVEIVVHYETSAIPAHLTCTKELYDELFTEEREIADKSGTFTFSFTSSQKWTAPEPGSRTLEAETFCHLNVNEDTLTVSAADPQAELPSK